MKNHRFVDITNQRFGRLIAIEPTTERRNSHVVWLCQCDCGNYIEIDGSDLRSGDTKSCGCLRRDNGLSYVGEKSPVWIKDRTIALFRRLQGQSTESNQLKRKCFERDNFRCVSCGDNKQLHAHHIYNWKQYPELRFDLNNLITLCAKCHREFHAIYGNKHNTSNQFYEWMNVI